MVPLFVSVLELRSEIEPPLGLVPEPTARLAPDWTVTLTLFPDACTPTVSDPAQTTLVLAGGVLLEQAALAEVSTNSDRAAKKNGKACRALFKKACNKSCEKQA